MKTITLKVWRELATGVLFFAFAAAGFAQVVTPPGQVKKVDPAQQAQDFANYRNGMTNANALAKAGNVAAAEQALIQIVKAKPNTAAWHIETAQRMTQIAEQLARQGQPRNVSALANGALQHLTQADALTRDPRTHAAAKSLEGFINERYLANPAAALASYKAAMLASPTTASKAKEAADRLQKNADALKARSGKGGRS